MSNNSTNYKSCVIYLMFFFVCVSVSSDLSDLKVGFQGHGVIGAFDVFVCATDGRSVCDS